MMAGIHLQEFLTLFMEALKEYKKINKSITEVQFLKMFLYKLNENFTKTNSTVSQDVTPNATKSFKKVKGYVELKKNGIMEGSKKFKKPSMKRSFRIKPKRRSSCLVQNI